MTDTMLDPRITAWLDDGPSRAPDDAFEAIVAVVATTPSLRPVLHVGSRPVFRQQLAADSRRPFAVESNRLQSRRLVDQP